MATTTTPDAGMLSSWYDSYKSQQTQAPTATDATATATTATTTSGSAPMLQSTKSEPSGMKPLQVAQWTPDTNSTVQGQLTNVLDKSSPLMDRAATKAAQTMNSRGLLNSSMAIGAGQSALYDAALPIAQQDANTFAAAGKANADAQNASNTLQAQFGQQTRLAMLDANTQKDLQAADAALKTGMQNTDNNVRQSMQQYELSIQQAMNQTNEEGKIKLAQMDADNRLSLAKIEADYKNQLQQSQSSAVTYQSMVDSITKIMLDPNLDAEGKQTAINGTTTLYRNALEMQSKVSGLNLGTILAPGDVSAPPASVPGSGVAPGSVNGQPNNPGDTSTYDPGYNIADGGQGA